MGIGIAYDGGLSQLDYIIIGCVTIVLLFGIYLTYRYFKNKRTK